MSNKSVHPWETLAPGANWRGWWTATASMPPIPVLAARGAGGDGPTLLVTGGVHGDEYEGPAAIHALFAGLDCARLRGRVIGLPVLNGAAWEARTRTSPGDGVNLNRVFGAAATEADGPTAALAAAVFSLFMPRCDALLDLHSGGVALDHLPLIGWYGERGGEAERLARGFDPAFHPWVLPDVPGVLSYEAHRSGKTALGAEWRGGARLDPDGAAAYTAGLRRVLAAQAMLLPAEDAAPPPTDQRPPIRGDYQETTRGGLFRPAVRPGDRIAEGELLGILHDPLGEVVAEIRAERAGTVAGLPHIPWLHPGDRVAYIG